MSRIRIMSLLLCAFYHYFESNDLITQIGQLIS